MDILANALLLVLLRVCCKGVLAATDLEELDTPEVFEKQCVWPRPPKNGVNFRQCGNDLQPTGQLRQKLCREKEGTRKSPGVTKFTECLKGHVLTEGDRQAHCADGVWSGGWQPEDYKCIECGRSLLEEHTVILKGKEADSGDFPWMAALFFKNEEDKWVNQCGGTLVTAHMVITAAHCVRWTNNTIASPKNVRVGLGKLKSNFNKREPASVIKTVREVIVKSRYNGIALNYAEDIAVLDLETPVTTNEYIMPACVDWAKKMPGPSAGQPGYLAGYGITEDGSPSNVLKWAKQNYKNDSECQKRIPSNDKKLFTADKFCIISTDGASAQSGDSGGGLTFITGEVHYVYGVVSVRVKNDYEREDIVLYTSVHSHREWLVDQWRRLRPLHEEKTLRMKPNKTPAGSTGGGTSSGGVRPTSTVGNKGGEGGCRLANPNNVDRLTGEFCDVSREPLDPGRWSPAKSREFPFWAVVGSSNFVDWNHATLISDRFLLTEALYCVRLTLLGITLTEALVGAYLPNSRGVGEKYKIIDTIMHPQYNIYPAENFDNRFHNNLALIKLNTAVRFTNSIKPICLYTGDLNPGSAVVLPGEIKTSNDLSKENSQIIAKKVCDPENRFGAITCVQIDNGRNVWDQNGMPLLVRLKSSRCSFGLAGMSNYHFTYTRDARGYTKITPYVPWIEGVVRQQ